MLSENNTFAFASTPNCILGRRLIFCSPEIDYCRRCERILLFSSGCGFCTVVPEPGKGAADNIYAAIICQWAADQKYRNQCLELLLYAILFVHCKTNSGVEAICHQPRVWLLQLWWSPPILVWHLFSSKLHAMLLARGICNFSHQI
jgi:hypothetical protein